MSYPFDPAPPFAPLPSALGPAFDDMRSRAGAAVESKADGPEPPSDVAGVAVSPIVRWTNLDTDWKGGAAAGGAGAEDDDAVFASLYGGDSSEFASAMSKGSKRGGRSSKDLLRSTLTFSLTGSYSQNPSVSGHRRAQSAHFGSSGTRSGPVVAKLGSTDPAYSQVVLGHSPSASIGVQVTAGYRTGGRAVLGFGTRDDALKMHPSMAPGLNGSAEVGPGRYEPAQSLGRQVLSHRHSAAKMIFTAADRFASSSTRSKTPGPVYNPKITFSSDRYIAPAIGFGTSERKPLAPSPAPPPKYDTRGQFGESAPVARIGTSKRPPNVNVGCGVDVLYNLHGKYNGFQRKPQAASFPRGKRF